MNPLVSVIIPNYNREEYIVDCIQSVYEQSYRPIELIIVDDGSTDNSIKIIEECQNRLHSSIDFKIIILQQKNSGASRARNFGFEESKGDYIQWLDSDDLLLPHKIESQLKVFNKNIDVVYSRAQFFNEVPNQLMEKFWGRVPQGNSSDYFEFPWQTMCALYKKTALDKFGVWKENLSLSDDWEFSMRYKIKTKVMFLNNVSSLYRHHGGDRLGNNLSIQKINSLSSILIEIYTLSKENNLIDGYLTKRYQSRLMYCLMQYGVLNGKKERLKLIDLIKSRNLDNFEIRVLSIIPWIFFNRILFRVCSLSLKS